MRTKNLKSSEKGRSMMEMLVSIMIIGIIGVGGMAAIQHAQEVYRSWTLQAQLPKIVKNIDNVYAFTKNLTMANICQKRILDEHFGACEGNVYKTFGGDLTIEVLPDEINYRLKLSAVPRNICYNLRDERTNTRLRMISDCNNKVQEVIYTTEPETDDPSDE